VVAAATDGLAGEGLPRGGVAAPACDAELTTAQLLAQHVAPREVRRGGLGHELRRVVLAGLGLLDARRRGGGGGGVVAVAVGDGEDEGYAT